MSSLVVFSVNVRRLAAFYEAVLEVNPHHEPSGDIRLIGHREEVLVHSIPATIAKTIEVRTPPEPREGSALKPVFDVESLEAAVEQVSAKGGVVTARTFTLNGLTRRDVIDPDGNVIQLRGRGA
jgi:predicted enzyme related to lactoylglutathione lyase